MEFGIYFTKTKPPTGLQIPGTLKVDIPLVNFKGYLVIQLGAFLVFMSAEV